MFVYVSVRACACGLFMFSSLTLSIAYKYILDQFRKRMYDLFEHEPK